MTIQIEREETRCCNYMGYTFQSAANDLLYTPTCRQDSTYHSICYTSCGALDGRRNNYHGVTYLCLSIVGIDLTMAIHA